MQRGRERVVARFTAVRTVIADADADDFAACWQRDGNAVLESLAIEGFLIPRVRNNLASPRYRRRLRTEAHHEQRVAALSAQPDGQLHTCCAGPQRQLVRAGLTGEHAARVRTIGLELYHDQ